MQDIDPLDFQDQLLRGLTHKMNNILSLFHGYLAMITEDQSLDASTLAGLNRIKEGAFSASELMDRVQSLIRPTSIKVREVNLREVLGACQKGFELLASRGVKLSLTCEDNLPPVCADPNRLRTILAEIVSNAVEASPENGLVRIEAKFDTGAAQYAASVRTSPWALITVRNNANPIAPEAMKRVFEPFFTTRQSRSAFGLGLPVALALAKQLGGSLRFEQNGNESVCSLRLPLHQAV